MGQVIVLLVLAGFVLIVLLAGAGVLYWVFVGNKKGAKGPSGQISAPSSEPSFGPPPEPFPQQTLPASAPESLPPTHISPPSQPSWPSSPESFETHGPDDRAPRDTQQNERAATVAMYSNSGPGTNPMRDPALFETTPSADATAPFVSGLDPFATTPSPAPSAAEPREPAPTASLRDTSGTVVKLDAEGVRVGRHPECRYIIPTPGASRYHAEIKYDNGAWMISDLNSGNGTFVNGVRIRTHQLAPGDEVRIDQTLLTFQPGE
jgi:hypothetical protein